MDYVRTYAEFLKKFLKPKRKLKVVFDCSNGVTSLVIKRLKNSAAGKLEVILINEKIDGNFPAHGPNPLISGATKQLEKEVKKQKADLGVIFDGDGDRAFFIDDRGRFLDGDSATYFLARELKPKRLVVDLNAGSLIKKGFGGSRGVRVVISRIGTYFMKKTMRDHRASFAAERSGHFYFKEFFNSDSGIFAAIKMINAVSKMKTGEFSRRLDSLPKYYRAELALPIKNKNTPSILKKLEKSYRNSATNVSRLDGLTLEFNWGWLNIRPSNTEPLLRVNAEAADRAVMAKEIRALQKILTTNY